MRCPRAQGTVSLQSVVYPVVRETLAHSYSQWTTKDRQCCDWLMIGGPDDVSELPDLVRAHRGSLYSQ